MNQPRPSFVRRAFTLIELLVVIAIIAILVSLTTAGVMVFMKKGPQMVATNDITQLEISIQNFQQAYKVNYIPSAIVLCERLGDYDSTKQIDKDSIAYLTMLWPQLLSPDTSGVIKWVVGIDWTGDGVVPTGAANTANRMILEGDQCLVFFLGGIPIPGATLGVAGFSTDPRDPAKAQPVTIGTTTFPAQTTGRKGPYYEFPSSPVHARR